MAINEDGLDLFDNTPFSPVIKAKPNPARIDGGTPILDETKGVIGDIKVLSENIIHKDNSFDGMVETKLLFNIEPKSKQSVRGRIIQPKDGRKPFIHFYQDKDIEDYIKALRWSAIHTLPSTFKIYSECVYIVELEFRFPMLKGFTKKQIESIDSGKVMYKTTKPDLSDNIKKPLIDALSGITWKDDAIICSESNISKIYSRTPGILLRMVGR
jgi:Holliday junction resolvase RusA-like endonuclease